MIMPDLKMDLQKFLSFTAPSFKAPSSKGVKSCQFYN